MITQLVLASLVAVTAFAGTADANTLDFEGFHGGMPLSDFIKHRNDFRDLGESSGLFHKRPLTFGGVEFGRPTFVREYSSAVIAGAIRFRFDTRSFDKAVGSVKSLYPDTKCNAPTEKQGTVCHFQNADGAIMVIEHDADARSGYYLLSSDVRNALLAQHQQAKATAAAAATSAAADHIYIKDFRLGLSPDQLLEIESHYYNPNPLATMPMAEWNTTDKITALTARENTKPRLTLGGREVNWPSITKDTNGLIAQLLFTSDPGAFEDIKSALLTKYPRTKCENSVVSNAMGAKFNQVICAYQTDTETLLLSKYASTIEKSALSVATNAFIDKGIKEKQAAKSDL